MPQHIFVLCLHLKGGRQLVPATADPVEQIVSDLVETPGQIFPAADAAVKVERVRVQGYFAHQFGCSEVLQSIAQAFTSLGKCSIGGFQTGPLTITLVVEDPITQDTILALYNKGILIRRVNQTIQEYGSGFTDLKMLSQQTYMISDQDLQNVKDENGLLSSFIIEKRSMELTKEDLQELEVEGEILPSLNKLLSKKNDTITGKDLKQLNKESELLSSFIIKQEHRNLLQEANNVIIQIYMKFPKNVNLLAALSEANDQTQHACAKYFPAKFDFKGQKFTKEAVQGMVCVLRHVEQMEELDLSEQSLPPGSTQLIANAIKEGQVKVNLLYLSGKQISNDEIESVSSIVEHVEELNLSYCRLSSESIAIICNAISDKEYKKKKLGLSGNDISNDVIESLCHIVEYVEELNLGHCGLSSESIAIICNVISEKRCKMAWLSLHGNPISNDGAKSLSSVVEHVAGLYLRECKLSSESIAVICNAIRGKKCKMAWLSLHGNPISNDGAKSLSSVIEYVEVLDLRGCKLSSESIAIICNAIREKKCKVKWLDLPENHISNDGAKSLSSIVEYVEKLVLGQHQITEEGMEVIRSKLRKLYLPIDRVRFVK